MQLLLLTVSLALVALAAGLRRTELGFMCDLVDNALEGERASAHQTFDGICEPFAAANLKSCNSTALPAEAFTLAQMMCKQICAQLKPIPYIGQYCSGPNPTLVGLCLGQAQPLLLQGLQLICNNNGQIVPPTKACSYAFCRGFNYAENTLNYEIGCPNKTLTACSTQ